MSSEPPQLRVTSQTDDLPSENDNSVPDMASLSIAGNNGETLSPFSGRIDEKYSIVQPGVLLTELQPELTGEIVRSTRPRQCGGNADVYHGSWTGPDGNTVEVAIKVLRVVTPSSRTEDREKLRKKIDIRMKRETLIWARAKHRHIHTFLGFKWSNEPQLISPWCAQGNLNDYITRRKDISKSDKLRLICQTGLGLAYLHNQNPQICHADIKPENILITDSLDAVLSDFGISRVIDSLAEHTGLTTTGGGVQGTYPYTAPELFDPTLLGVECLKPKPTCESDVYAFGRLILAVLSGQTPFHRIGHKPLIMMAVLEGRLPEPQDHRGLPENDPLWLVMKGCWCFEPSNRLLMGEVLDKITSAHALARLIHYRSPEWPNHAFRACVRRLQDTQTIAEDNLI